MHIKCFPISDQAQFDACQDIRNAVFVEEQGVPADREIDGKDKDSRHFAVSADDKMIGTCRVRFIGSAAKIERVAVLKEFRSRGIGKVLMKYILQELGKTGDIQLFKLSAQAQVLPFYEKLGFKIRGNEYMDAGIPHYDMVLEK